MITTGLFHKMKKISKKDELDLYYSILRIRKIEERIAKEYINWKIRCPVHLSIGQEAIGAPLKKLFKSYKNLSQNLWFLYIIYKNKKSNSTSFI